MPTSQHYQIGKIMDLIISLNPQSLLDVGTGFGKYGVLSREYLEFWDGKEDYSFERVFDGVEVYKKYLTPLHKFIYNKIYIGNALEVIDKLERSYDVVLLIDVIEHFTKEEGNEFVKKVLAKNKGIIISTPKNIGRRGVAFENVHEAHISQWRPRDFRKLGRTYFSRDLSSYVVYIGPDKLVKKVRRGSFKRRVREFVRVMPILPSIYYFFTKQKMPDSGHIEKKNK